MVNKVGEEPAETSFSSEDEEAFRLFSVYCGLALHYAKLYDKIRRSEGKLKAEWSTPSQRSGPRCCYVALWCHKGRGASHPRAP